MDDLVTLRGFRQSPARTLFCIPGDPEGHVVYLEDFYYAGRWQAKISRNRPLGGPVVPVEIPRTLAVSVCNLALDRWASDMKRVSDMANTWARKPQEKQYVARVLKKENRPFETTRAFRNSLVLQGIRKKTAARAIQRQFKEAIANPAYRMCKNRLLREFESMA
jgi:hypothetical protein